MKYIVSISIVFFLLVSSCKKETPQLPDVVVCNVKTSAQTIININGKSYTFDEGSYHDAKTFFNINFVTRQNNDNNRWDEEIVFRFIPSRIGKYNLYHDPNNNKIPRAEYSVWDIDVPIDASNSYDSTANWVEITEICEEGGIKGKVKLKLKQKDGFYHPYHYYGNVKELNIEFSFAIKKRN